MPTIVNRGTSLKALAGFSFITPAAVYIPTQTGGVIIPIPAKATNTTYKWSKLWSKDNVRAANIGTVK